MKMNTALCVILNKNTTYDAFAFSVVHYYFIYFFYIMSRFKIQFIFQYKLNGQSVGIKMLTESFFNFYYNRN